MAVEEVHGIDPTALNDHRIGRALDAITPELDSIVGSISTSLEFALCRITL
jgi:hypothetical protein